MRFFSFDLSKGPLIRTRLLRLGNREHLLLISTHQAICDGWSLGVFVEELVALYGAFSAQKESPLAPAPIQFADFAQWQRAWRSHPEMLAQLAYWREQLHGPLPSMRLAVSRAKRQIDDLRTARRAWALPASSCGRREALQPPTRRHRVYDARRGPENAAASLFGPG